MDSVNTFNNQIRQTFKQAFMFNCTAELSVTGDRSENVTDNRQQ